jgi:hypothetical protein
MVCLLLSGHDLELMDSPLILYIYSCMFDCSVFFYIIIIIIILLIIRVIKVKFEIYEWQRATSSDAEQTRHCLWRLCVKQCKYAIVSGVFV